MLVNKRIVKQWIVFLLSTTAMVYLYASARSENAQPSAAKPPEPIARPKDSDFVGTTKCAACHFKQFQSWKASPHGRTYDYLPTKYRNNAECLQCHTGRHERIALQQNGTNKNSKLSGVSCEDCHGAGKEHANLALSYVDQRKELTDDAVKILRSKIQRTALDQCIRCHLSQAHKAHPKFDREEPAQERLPTLNDPGRRRRLLGH